MLTEEYDMRKAYTVADGRIVLNLTEAEEGGYIVTSPLDPELITEAETIEEAFANARDALKALARSRAKLLQTLRGASAKPRQAVSEPVLQLESARRPPRSSKVAACRRRSREASPVK